MDFYKRLGMYFFAIGAILSLLAGAFPVSDSMYAFVMIVLVFLGVFSAILNVDEEEELAFVVAAAGFLIAVLCFKVLLGGNVLVANLASFFEVATLFVGSMLVTVAIRTVVELGSEGEGDPLGHADDVTDHVESLLYTKGERIWHFVVFIAVAFSFVVVLLDVFFSLQSYSTALSVLDIIITVVFFIDLILLYRRAGSFGRFLRTCWPDTIATIPFFPVLRVAKLVRLVRLMRFVKLNKTLKFFSERSGVKHYLHAAASKPHYQEEAEHEVLPAIEEKTEVGAKRGPRRRPKK